MDDLELMGGLMGLALEQAEKAADVGEVPVGAIAYDRTTGTVIARAHNLVETNRDASAHAEMLLLKEASNRLSSWRLNALTVCVTLEPCPMCLGAMRLARVGRIVFGAKDLRWGAAGSKIDLVSETNFGPVPEVVSGVRAEESERLLKSFFRKLRQDKTD